MKVYSIVDNRELNGYPTLQLFKNLKDAEDMRNSFGLDKSDFDIHEIEVVE